MRRAALAAIVLLSLASSPIARAGERPPFHATISPIDHDTRELMTGRSWHEGCPVGFDKLRLITMRYWGFDDRAHWGRLVVHRGFAKRIVDVFHTMYAHRVHIHRMLLVDRYGADDLRSMEHDNTSGFNCRWRAGQPGVWSMHAYGKAIDINTIENPYVSGGHVSPEAGKAYLDRSQWLPGMFHHDDVTVRAFASIGWEWGGAWTGSTVDYQHFSANDR